MSCFLPPFAVVCHDSVRQANRRSPCTRLYGRGALSIAEVAQRTGLSRAGARRYLLTLQERSYVVQSGADLH